MTRAAEYSACFRWYVWWRIDYGGRWQAANSPSAKVAIKTVGRKVAATRRVSSILFIVLPRFFAPWRSRSHGAWVGYLRDKVRLPAAFSWSISVYINFQGTPSAHRRYRHSCRFFPAALYYFSARIARSNDYTIMRNARRNRARALRDTPPYTVLPPVGFLQ